MNRFGLCFENRVNWIFLTDKKKGVKDETKVFGQRTLRMEFPLTEMV